MSGLHIDNDAANAPMAQLQNASGLTLETLGGIDVLLNSTIRKPQLRLTEDELDYAWLRKPVPVVLPVQASCFTWSPG